MIASGQFKDAYENCHKVLAKDSSRPLTNLLAAISILNGGIIDKMSQSAIIRIEEHIKKVSEHSNLFPTAMAMLGIIKYEYYVANGLDEKRPSIEEITDILQKSRYHVIDFDLLGFLKPSDISLNKLGVKK